MQFSFTEDQLALREGVSRFLMAEVAPEVLREIWQEDTGRSPQLRQSMAEQGICAISIPEEYDGLGMGEVMWSLISQEMGYYSIPDSLIDSAFIGAGIIQALPDSLEHKASYLQRIAVGALRVSISHPANKFVPDAHLADVVLHFAQDGLYLLKQGEFNCTFNPSIDSSRRLYTMDFELAKATKVLDAQASDALAEAAMIRGTLANAGQMLGLAQRMLDLSIDYVNQRKQFGKLIGSFQALKHKLADVVSKIEISKPAFFHASYALEFNLEDAKVSASRAVLLAREAAMLAAKHGIQCHGAMGYTWEVDLQMFMKRCYALQSSWGTNGEHQQIVFDFITQQTDKTGPGYLFSSPATTTMQEAL